MNDHNRIDLKIYGQGSSSGGEYKTISIMGEGEIKGDTTCNDIKIYGEGEITGNITAESTFSIKGHTGVKGNVNAKKIKLQGELDVDGELYADETVLTGTLTTKGDCNAEIFNLEGNFTINGLLNADKLKINLYWASEVREIGGSEITIKRDGKLSFLGIKNRIMPSEHSNILKAEIIEGDDVYLENTIAKVVRGNNITLGPGCKIELVEYKNNFKQDKNSQVGSNKTI